jgi:hypothetical protein
VLDDFIITIVIISSVWFALHLSLVCSLRYLTIHRESELLLICHYFTFHLRKLHRVAHSSSLSHLLLHI